MIKLIDILNEIDIPKNKWVTIPASELEDYNEEIYKLIDNAYAPIGGHPNYKSADDITGSEVEAEYQVIDLDKDPGIDAVTAAKSKAAGKKFTAVGHDGSDIAKSKVINHKAAQLKSKGYYVEVSGKIKDIFKAKGVEPVDDEELVRKVLKGKEIKWLGNGEYIRTINGKNYTKVLMGKPEIR